MKALQSAFIIIGVLLCFSRVWAQEKVAIIMPQIQLEVGETRRIDAFIKCISGTCAAFEATISYDPNIVQVDETELGPFLGEPSLVVANEVDNQGGSILMAATTLGDVATTDTTVLMSITIKGLATGVSRLGIDRLLVGDPAGNALDVAAFDGDVTVSTTAESNSVSGTLNLLGFSNVNVSLEAILPAFKQAYPNVDVQTELLDFHEAHDRLLNDLIAGTEVADIAVVEHSRLQQMVKAGGLENLSAAPYNADQYADDFVQWIWQLGVNTDGNVVAIPANIGPGTFFYRRDLFEAAGLPSDPATVAQMTSTWDGFLDVCRQLTDPANHRWCLSTANDIVYTNVHIGRFFDENERVRVNDPDVIRLVEIAMRAREAGVDAQVGTWSPEWEDLFLSGGIAVHFDGSWLGGSLQTWLKPEDSDWTGKWGVFPVPENAGQNRGGSSLVIPANSQNKEAAWALIKFMLINKSSVNAKFIVGEDFPAYIPAYDDPLYNEPLPFYDGQQARALWREVALETRSLYVTPADDGAVDILGKWLGRILSGRVELHEGMDQAADEIDALLKTYNGGPVNSNCKYTVQAGDSLTAIATRFNVNVDQVLQLNQLSSANLIVVGQVLDLPTTC